MPTVGLLWVFNSKTNSRMHGFRTSRALIIDDTLKEALPVIHALGALGIASLYHDASPDADYSRKHSGLRLLFLDMVLENRGATENDAEGAANILVGALDQIIEPSAAPLVVVCWTKYKDFKEDFKKAFVRAFPNTRLEDVLLLNKDDFSDPEKRNVLLERIDDALATLRPLSLLLSWEQMVHDAATQTTSALANLVQSAVMANGSKWDDAAYQICAALALAERGSRLADEQGEHALAAFYDCLTPLLADRLDHMGLRRTLTEVEASHEAAPVETATVEPTGVDSKAEAALTKVEESKAAETNKVTPDKPAEATPLTSDTIQSTAVGVETASKLLETVKNEVNQWKLNASLLSSSLRAGLNTMLLVSENVRSDVMCPGYVFSFEPNSSNSKATKQCLSCWKDALHDTFVISGRPPTDCVPVLVEMTAVCDFAQDKAKLPRFVAGFIFPEATNGIFRGTVGYTRRLGPLLFNRDTEPKLKGVYFLGLNAHFVVSLNRALAEQLTPFLRLRAAPLADCVAWVSQQAMRPGYTTVGP